MADPVKKPMVRVNKRGQVRPCFYSKNYLKHKLEPPPCQQDIVESNETPSDDDKAKEIDSDSSDSDSFCCDPEEDSENYDSSDEEESSMISDILDDISSNHEEESSMVGDTLDDTCSMDTPIYSGHTMSIATSMLLIFMFTMTHSTSGKQLNDLLTLIGCHCLTSHPGLKSLYHFKKYFAHVKSPLVKHHYCSSCYTGITPDAKQCPNTLCMLNITSQSRAYFLEIPIEQQLKNLISRNGFAKLVKHRFTRKKKNAESIEDIYDGSLYKHLAQPGSVLSTPYNLSLMWNTDGVSVFKSSKFSVWPLYLQINELPYHLRKKKENMLIYGLWFGNSKPFFPAFSEPLHKSLINLENNGIVVNIDGKQTECRAFLICGTADLPAKSLALNLNQFNGAFSCHKCLQRGETFRTENGGNIHIFPYIPTVPRTHSQSVHDAVEAVRTRQVVNGIKGPSFLMALTTYDYVKGTAVDYMHAVLLGLTRLFLKLWFFQSHCKEKYSLSHVVGVVDKRLKNIKPPAFITRVPRAISSHAKYWKASELRSWLFFYSIPILSDMMAFEYLHHYAAFVEGIYLLCGDSISESDIQRSQEMLTYVVASFATLYHKRYCTLNLHLLLHLPQCVKELGPLWVYSCFSFEDANGKLCKLFHGTQHIELQIMSAIYVIHSLPSLLYQIPYTYQDFASRLNKHQNKISKQGTYCLGRGYVIALPNYLKVQLAQILLSASLPIVAFNRVLCNGVLYHSKKYARVTKRNTYNVKYICDATKTVNFGFIECFLSVKQGLAESVFAVMIPLKRIGPIDSERFNQFIKLSIPYIHLLYPSHPLVIVDVNMLLSLTVCVEIDSSVFVCDPPNTIESD